MYFSNISLKLNAESFSNLGNVILYGYFFVSCSFLCTTHFFGMKLHRFCLNED